MTPHEIVSSKDFETIIRFAIKRYNLDGRIKSYEDFVQDVAAHILRFGSGNYSKSHVIVNHCKWVSCGYVEKRTRKKKFYKIPYSYIDPGFARVDEEDTRAVKLAKLTPRQRQIVEARLSGVDNAALAESLGVSRQNIHCVITTAFERLNNYDKKERTC
jgi:predicted DNA binding protein